MNFFFLLIFSIFSWSQTSTPTPTLGCLELEGIQLGCVPAPVHACFRNKNAAQKNTPCEYGSGFATQFESDTGPIQFHCKARLPDKQICQTNPEGGQECRTEPGDCIDYAPATCHEKCVGCFANSKTANVGEKGGCIVCTRNACADEPPGWEICPGSHEGMQYIGDAPKCGNSSRCPESAVDPLGKTHTITIKRDACPTKPPEQENPSPGKHCPWIDDKRTTACEPIDEDNKYRP